MIANDVRYAVRRLVRTPGFTAVAVLSLALGIGANTAVFSVINAVLLRGMPVADGHELVEVYSSSSDGFQYATSSHPDYLDLRSENPVFSHVVGTRTFIGRLDVDDAPRVVFGELVSWDYFQALGIPMALGRAFVEEEDGTTGTHPVTILGHRTWSRDFAADPGIVGERVYLNGRPYTVVGVAPEAFTASMPLLVSGVFVPLAMTDVVNGGEQLARRQVRNLFLKARLLPGVSLEQANDALRSFSASLEERYPDSNTDRYMSVLPSSGVAIHPEVDGLLTPVAGLLLGVVGLVLLIACTNLASFLLARAEERRREIAVRLALGAGRGRLVRQLLTETVILAALGGALGVVVANWTVRLVMSLQPALPVPIDIEISLDPTVLLFTAAVSIFAGLAFGLAPALQATRPDVTPALKNGSAAGGAGKRVSLRDGLVVTQVAFSLVLLIGAGLFVRSFQRAQTIDPGFDVGPGALVTPLPELAGYETPEQRSTFYAEYEDRLLANPIVTEVALADRLPLGAAVQTGGYLIPGVPSSTPDGDHDIDNAHVSVGYFDVMDVAIVAGRGFDVADRDGDHVVIVSRAFADSFYPGEDVVGRTIRFASSERELTIVGVAADTKVRTLGEERRPYVYHLLGQMLPVGGTIVIRGSASGDRLVAAARQVLDEVSPRMVLLQEIKSMTEHLSLLLFPPRMVALLLSAFGGLALLLTAIGIYGVVSFAVSKRAREMGIRISLGATGRDVMGLAVGRGMRLVVVGSVAGIALAGGITGLLSRYLFEISGRDAATFITVPVILGLVALVAAWMPARRATLVDPVRTLRSE